MVVVALLSVGLVESVDLVSVELVVNCIVVFKNDEADADGVIWSGYRIRSINGTQCIEQSYD